VEAITKNNVDESVVFKEKQISLFIEKHSSMQK